MHVATHVASPAVTMGGLGPLSAFLKALLARAAAAGSSRTASRVAAPPEEHLLPATMAALTDEISERMGEEIRVVDQRVSMTGCQTVWVEGQRPYLVKLALRDDAGPRLENNATALAAVTGITANDVVLSRIIPQILHTGRFRGQVYSIETTLPGRNATEYLASRRTRSDLGFLGLRFLRRLQTLSRSDTVLDLETWNQRFQPMLDAVGAFVKHHDSAGVYDSIARRVRDPLLDQTVPLVFAHGNFWIGNLLFEPDLGLSGVIDWDSAVEGGLPFVDLLYFLVRTDSLIQNTSLGEAVSKWIAADLKPLVGHPLVEAYRQEFAIPRAWLRPLFYVCWIQHIHSHVRYGTPALQRPAWLSRNVVNVLSAFHRSVTIEA